LRRSHFCGLCVYRSVRPRSECSDAVLLAYAVSVVRVQGHHKNSRVQVEALVRALLEPLGRRERQKLLGLLGKDDPMKSVA
jgi:hypothetical protein